MRKTNTDNREEKDTLKQGLFSRRFAKKPVWYKKKLQPSKNGIQHVNNWLIDEVGK